MCPGSYLVYMIDLFFIWPLHYPALFRDHCVITQYIHIFASPFHWLILMSFSQSQFHYQFMNVAVNTVSSTWNKLFCLSFVPDITLIKSPVQKYELLSLKLCVHVIPITFAQVMNYLYFAMSFALPASFWFQILTQTLEEIFHFISRYSTT